MPASPRTSSISTPGHGSAPTRHPTLGRLFTELTYRPQKELLAFLRANGFKNFIVSGGGIDLIRAFAEEAYGIPRDQVVGSSVKTSFEIRDGRGVLVKLPEIDSFDDREIKPHNIGLHIGRRPLLAFGNSDGDLAMLRYTASGPGPRLALLIHHDDAEREFAYDREFRLSPLAEALDKAERIRHHGRQHEAGLARGVRFTGPCAPTQGSRA